MFGGDEGPYGFSTSVTQQGDAFHGVPDGSGGAVASHTRGHSAAH